MSPAQYPRPMSLRVFAASVGVSGRRRILWSFTAALVAGWFGIAAVSDASRRSHYGCHYFVGGDAPGGTYLCPDGTSYAMPLFAAFVLPFVVVLAVGLVWRGPAKARR